MSTSRFFKLVVSLAVVLTAGLAAASMASAVTVNKVLLFGPSVSGGANSFEAQQAAAQGLGVDVVDASTWSSMTTAQFAQYRAIIIGDNLDNNDGSGPTPAPYLDPIVNNAGVWGAAVTGNVVLTGADAEYHADPGFGDDPGAVTWINRALAFAAGSAAQTGAYVALGDYYDGTDTPAPILDAFGAGGFSVTSDSSNDIHIDPAFTGPTGLSDSILSNWGDTTHQWFTRYPTAFKVWAIGIDPGGTYTTSDGQKGLPTFLSRPALAQPLQCVVPKVKGKSLKKAKKKLRRSNCKLGKKKGHGKKVRKQKPKPGTVLPGGSKVKVTVH